MSENMIAKLQILYSPPRNLRARNKLPAHFLKKPLCTGDLLPAHKIFIERSAGIASLIAKTTKPIELGSLGS